MSFNLYTQDIERKAGADNALCNAAPGLWPKFDQHQLALRGTFGFEDLIFFVGLPLVRPRVSGLHPDKCAKQFCRKLL